MPSPSTANNDLIDRVVLWPLHDEIDNAKVRQSADAGRVRRRDPARRRITARLALVVGARIDLALGHEFAGRQIDEAHADALDEHAVDILRGNFGAGFQQASCEQHVLLHVEPGRGRLHRLQPDRGHRDKQRADHADCGGEKDRVAGAVTLQHGAFSA